MHGIALLLSHPEVASRDCKICQKYCFDEKTGALSGTPENPVPRPPKGPPCRWRENGCPKGTPEKQKSLSPRNQKAYQHYLECKATGIWPDDPIVKRNAGIIRRIEEAHERSRQDCNTELMKQVIQAALIR